MLERTERRLKAHDVEVEFADEEAVALLTEQDFDPEFGAGPLRRTIQRRGDNQPSRMVLDGSLEPGSKVLVGAEDGELTFKIPEREAVAGGAAQGPEAILQRPCRHRRAPAV